MSTVGEGVGEATIIVSLMLIVTSSLAMIVCFASCVKASMIPTAVVVLVRWV